MSKYVPIKPNQFCAVKKWKSGGESICEYFTSSADAENWIKKQPIHPDYEWCVGEWE